MCYQYMLSIHCAGCGREISRWLEVFCAADYCQEAFRRLDPRDRCYIGKDPSQYPRKDVKIPGTAYNYFLWSDHECEMCQKGRQVAGFQAQSIARNQNHKTNSNQKYVDARDVKDIENRLTAENFANSGKMKPPTKPKIARRVLSKEEKRRRKLQIEALFKDSKSLEHR